MSFSIFTLFDTHVLNILITNRTTTIKLLCYPSLILQPITTNDPTRTKYYEISQFVNGDWHT
ncbi:hypothetical protein PP707_03755 [Acetobacter pasteurianus]|nr:hypothetical protein [Acetobacter pasteurianus]